MRKVIFGLLAMLLMATACSSIDCPINNRAYTKYRLQGNVKTLTDTLTVLTKRQDGQDTILLNKSVGKDSFELPMSYIRTVDELYFALTNKLNQTTHDTVRITKTNYPHFESVDCPLAYFHTITGVSTTLHNIDSIVVNSSNVTYDISQPHFYIYFKSGH